MPVQVFNSINDLVAYVQAELPSNGNQEITAARHREVMQSTILSLASMLTSLPPAMVMDYPAWESGTTYVGAEEVIVRHNGKLWLFVSGEGQTGVEPGSNFTVWSEVGALQTAHLRNRDTHLAQGSQQQVSSAEIRSALDAPKYWGSVVLDLVPEPYTDSDGDIYAVGSEPSGPFTGRAGKLATRVAGSWVFSDPIEGESRQTLYGRAIIVATQDGWVPVAGEYVVALANQATSYMASRPYEVHEVGGSPYTLHLNGASAHVITAVASSLTLENPLNILPLDYIIVIRPEPTGCMVTWPSSWVAYELPPVINRPLVIRAMGVPFSGPNGSMHVYSAQSM